ncbi:MULTISPECIES: HutD/Ves family protein [unclassified Streptomyces]|uniref:HutD/Ves family protein n=1 Tax=unclassified Streptomyces TaxID=2593676 RepID=UPI002DD849C0|nr:HutD family protein [Streptomyces sp. NBC_01237]WRZ71864.1 HutD family protein [Streptomyces sp. NBC_01237]
MAGSPHVLRAAVRTAVPWRNGGGVTREIAVHPAGAPMDAFDWRVSLADVDADGPFSAFEGVDRTLTVVEGAGMDLIVDGEHHIVDEPYWPYDFPGDLTTEGLLLAGPVVNLNVMYRRSRTRAETAVVRGTVRLLPPHGGTVLALALDGGAVIDGTDVALGRYDAVLATGGSPGVLRTMGDAVVITLSPV